MIKTNLALGDGKALTEQFGKHPSTAHAHGPLHAAFGFLVMGIQYVHYFALTFRIVILQPLLEERPDLSGQAQQYVGTPSSICLMRSVNQGL